MRLFFLILLLAGCQKDLAAPRALAALDEPFFRCRVHPVVAKQCGAFACHGDGRRYFRVFARNRLRLGGGEADRNALLRSDEESAGFDAARAWIIPGDEANSLLLHKPLSRAAGGYFHRADEIFPDGDVFATADDPEYQVLVAWVNGATDDPACPEPGSDQ